MDMVPDIIIPADVHGEKNLGTAENMIVDTVVNITNQSSALGVPSAVIADSNYKSNEVTSDLHLALNSKDVFGGKSTLGAPNCCFSGAEVNPTVAANSTSSSILIGNGESSFAFGSTCVPVAECKSCVENDSINVKEEFVEDEEDESSNDKDEEDAHSNDGWDGESMLWMKKDI